MPERRSGSRRTWSSRRRQRTPPKCDRSLPRWRRSRLPRRPLSPLHGGHVALLTTSGLINGIFGEGPDLHVARWESVKVTDRFEETDEDDVTTIRERERFTQCL